MCAVGRRPYRGSQQFILLGRRRYLCDVMLNKIKFDEYIFCWLLDKLVKALLFTQGRNVRKLVEIKINVWVVNIMFCTSHYMRFSL